MITVAPHPTLELVTLRAEFRTTLGELPSPDDLVALLNLNSDAPLKTDDDVRARVRDLLRHGGFKPTGRSKPAAEFLLKAATNGTLQSINLAVDVCNVVSLHSGLPISVIDLDRAEGGLNVEIAPPDTSYIFNQSGQSIAVGGLLCVGDDRGPCGNAVKDSQRTKTDESTRNTLSLIWGTNQLPGRAQVAAKWYAELLAEHADVQIETYA